MKSWIPSSGCTNEMRAFGRDLVAFLETEYPKYVGWDSEECVVVARALKLWIGLEAELWVHSAFYYWTIEHPGPQGQFDIPFDHVMVKVGRCFLDNQGAHTLYEISKHWPSFPDLGPVFRPANATDYNLGLRRWRDKEVQALARNLRRTFGPGHKVLQWAETEPPIEWQR